VGEAAGEGPAPSSYVNYSYKRLSRWRMNEGTAKVFKVNHRQQRSERNRVKQAKKDAKLHAREDAAARRKLEAEQRGEPGDTTPKSEAGEPE